MIGQGGMGDVDGRFYLLMDTHALAPKEALAIVPQICDALQYAHEQGVVHRDIKSENGPEPEDK